MLLDAPEVDAQDDQGEPDLGYRIQLDAFSGPLDLLLYLVRRAEVDIQDIPIAAITDQFLATLRAWEELDLDLAGDFILMAATLLEIKARTIAPIEDAETVDDEEDLIDPRADLIRQLLAFRQCKEWAHRLQDCEDAFMLVRHRRTAEDIPEAEDEASFDLENADPYQLFKVWDDILGDIAGKSPRTVVYDDVPIDDRMRQIISTMSEAKEGRLSWLMTHVDTRIKRIGVFVALLECVRKRALEAIQHEQYADVYLHYREEADRVVVPLEPEDAQVDDETDAEDGDATVDDAAEPKKKRVRRRGPLQLFTYHAPIQAVQEILPEIEETLTVETEEDRFRRELNEQTAVDDVLGTVKRFDDHMHEHLVVRRICQGPLPADAVVDEAPAIELPDEEIIDEAGEPVAQAPGAVAEQTAADASAAELQEGADDPAACAADGDADGDAEAMIDEDAEAADDAAVLAVADDDDPAAVADDVDDVDDEDEDDVDDDVDDEDEADEEADEEDEEDEDEDFGDFDDEYDDDDDEDDDFDDDDDD